MLHRLKIVRLTLD